jgi:guanine nucleotide-binding protein subunit alpha
MSLILRARPIIIINDLQVLLLGSGDSGKSTILKQMRLIHKVPFSPQEIESYRQLVFDNLTRGMAYCLDSMEDMDLRVSDQNQQYVDLVMSARDIRDGEPFPTAFYQPLKALWNDPNVRQAWNRGNEAALPEKCVCSSIRLTRRSSPSLPTACHISTHR